MSDTNYFSKTPYPENNFVLLSSASSKPVSPGDTLYFSYAINAYQPTPDNPFDTIPVLENGKRITTFFHLAKKTKIAILTQERNEIRISPNPATTQLNLWNSSERLTAISIFNILGVKVANYSFRGDSQFASIPLEPLPLGCYTVRINNKFYTKFIKQ